MTAARWIVDKVAGRDPRPLPRPLLEAPAQVVFLWPADLLKLRPLPRVLSEAEAAPMVQPDYPAETPFPGRFLASKGWEMGHSGVWIRQNGARNA